MLEFHGGDVEFAVGPGGFDAVAEDVLVVFRGLVERVSGVVIHGAFEGGESGRVGLLLGRVVFRRFLGAGGGSGGGDLLAEYCG